MRCAGTIPAVPMHNDESIHAHASAAGCIVGGSNAAELHNVCRMCAPRGRVAPRCVRETLAERAVISPEAPAGGPRTALRASCVRDGSESSSTRRVGGPVVLVGRPDECVCESVMCVVCVMVSVLRRRADAKPRWTSIPGRCYTPGLGRVYGRCVRICCEPMALARCHGRSRVAIRRVWTFDRAQPRDDPRAAEWAAAQ